MFYKQIKVIILLGAKALGVVVLFSTLTDIGLFVSKKVWLNKTNYQVTSGEARIF